MVNSPGLFCQVSRVPNLDRSAGVFANHLCVALAFCNTDTQVTLACSNHTRQDLSVLRVATTGSRNITELHSFKQVNVGAVLRERVILTILRERVITAILRERIVIAVLRERVPATILRERVTATTLRE